MKNAVTRQNFNGPDERLVKSFILLVTECEQFGQRYFIRNGYITLFRQDAVMLDTK